MPPAERMAVRFGLWVTVMACLVELMLCAPSPQLKDTEERLAQEEAPLRMKRDSLVGDEPNVDDLGLADDLDLFHLTSQENLGNLEKRPFGGINFKKFGRDVRSDLDTYEQVKRMLRSEPSLTELYREIEAAEAAKRAIGPWSHLSNVPMNKRPFGPWSSLGMADNTVEKRPYGGPWTSLARADYNIEKRPYGGPWTSMAMADNNVEKRPFGGGFQFGKRSVGDEVWGGVEKRPFGTSSWKIGKRPFGGGDWTFGKRVFGKRSSLPEYDNISDLLQAAAMLEQEARENQTPEKRPFGTGSHQWETGDGWDNEEDIHAEKRPFGSRFFNSNVDRLSKRPFGSGSIFGRK